MIVDWGRCKVVHPDGTVPRGRFVFHNGRAAVWVEDKREKTATRVLFATGATFTQAETARVPHLVSLEGDGQWEIRQESGGCGCGSKLKTFTVEQLLSDDFSTYP